MMRSNRSTTVSGFDAERAAVEKDIKFVSKHHLAETANLEREMRRSFHLSDIVAADIHRPPADTR